MVDEDSLLDFKIHIRPSPELIPDEYQINSEIAAYIFTDSRLNCDVLKQTLKIPQKNVFKLNKVDTTKEELTKIKESLKDQSMLIIFFNSYYKESEDKLKLNHGDLPLHEIWRIFMDPENPVLIDKPKIFWFNLQKFPELTETDGVKHEPKNFEPPIETDMLIVYNRDHNNQSVFQQFCNNYEKYASQEDLLNLINYSESDDKQSHSVFVSTLKKKVYLKQNPVNRGHHHVILKQHENITKQLQSIKETLGQKPKGKTGRWDSIIDKFRKFHEVTTTDLPTAEPQASNSAPQPSGKKTEVRKGFSFRKTKKTVNQKDAVQNDKEKQTVTTGRRISSDITKSNDNPKRRTQISESDNEKSQQKPAWKH